MHRSSRTFALALVAATFGITGCAAEASEDADGAGAAQTVEDAGRFDVVQYHSKKNESVRFTIAERLGVFSRGNLSSLKIQISKCDDAGGCVPVCSKPLVLGELTRTYATSAMNQALAVTVQALEDFLAGRITDDEFYKVTYDEDPRDPPRAIFELVNAIDERGTLGVGGLSTTVEIDRFAEMLRDGIVLSGLHCN